LAINKQLAERLGVSSATVSDWENGKKMPRPENIEALSRELAVSMEYLLNTGVSEYSQKTNELSQILAPGKEAFWLGQRLTEQQKSALAAVLTSFLDTK
jgi:transcriptional regulator with XRE-family HTH domain